MVTQIIQTGKNEPMISKAGARAQPVLRRLTPLMTRAIARVLFIVADRPEVEWELGDWVKFVAQESMEFRALWSLQAGRFAAGCRLRTRG